jgi:hypothetical protein
MKTTRRDLLAWSGGAVAGIFFTPVPWKVLSDVSIWTQNWPWIPQPPRGPVDVKETTCTLCPNACGLRVKMAAGAAVGVAGLPSHPISRGALCPLAYGAHQLNWLPARLREVQHRGRKSSWDEATAAFRKAMAEGPIAIIDGRNGRAASALFARFAAAHGGSYSAVLAPEEKALTPYEKWTGVPVSSLGYDLENAHTIVSFGAPLLDGWATPGRFTRLWSEKAAATSDPELRIIQIEPEQSRTAAFAWKWIRVRPGAETALAAGIARVLIEERLVSAAGPMPVMTLQEASKLTGADPDAIRQLARTIVERTPAVVIPASENEAVAALNVVLGAVGARGGIIRRSSGADLQVSAGTPGRARAVVIDAAVPWDMTPNINAEVFRFAAWHGDDTTADWLLPAPGFLEEKTDMPTAPGSAIDLHATVEPLVAPPAGLKSAAEFLAGIDPGIAGQESRPAGAKAGELHCELREWPQSSGPSVRSSWTADWTLPVLPPLSAKLFQESDLREAPTRRNI